VSIIHLRIIRSFIYHVEKKDEFIWFHHTWKHEKLTNINDRISLIGSTETNLAFAQVNNLKF
jgi:hypothetical protein